MTMAAITGVICKQICSITSPHALKCFSLFPRYLSSRSDEKPKQPPTVYVSYFKSIFPELSKEHPGKTVPEIAKIAGTMYKSLSVEELQNLKDEHAQAYEDYKQRYNEWIQSLTEEDKELIAAEKAEKREKKKKMKIKSLRKKNMMPKKPVSSFNLYFSERLRASNLQYVSSKDRMQSIRMLMKDCGEKWKEMPESDKEIFIEKAREEYELYESQMRIWEADMIKDGKLNLIRKSTLNQEMKGKTPTKEMKRKLTSTKKQGVKSGSTGTTNSTMKESPTNKNKTVTFEYSSSDSD